MRPLSYCVALCAAARVCAASTNNLSRRGAAISCPGDIGGQPFSCHSDLCGGEDKANAGHCTKKTPAGAQCQCDKDGPTVAPVLTVVTATQGDKTVTATYALQTLAAYKGLRQPITTGITATTTSDGVATVQTAAAIVLAGGVSWFLAGLVGDLAVAEAVAEAPETADGNPEEDKTCPNPKSKCPDCSGKGGMCTTGTAAGCTCDEITCPKEMPSCEDKACAGANDKCTSSDMKDCECKPTCPTGDTQPICSDESCKAGSDNKCTAEGHKGCDCKQACPSVDEVLLCSDCGGEDEGKCKGTTDDNNKLKGCQCDKDPITFIYPIEMSSAQVVAAWSNLPTITVPTERDGTKATCQKAGWAAPQRDQDGSPSVFSKINEWCSQMDGHKITSQPEGVDTEFAMYKVHFWSFWLSASTWYTAPTANKCDKTVTISKDECIKTLNTAMIRCDPNNGDTHGASLPGKCINYNITLDGEANPASPPWNRLGPSASPACNTDPPLSGVQSNFFNGLFPQFCSEVDGDKPKALNKVLTNADFKNPAKKRWVGSNSLRIRTPPPNPNQYPDHKFHFDWTGGDGQCREDCTGAFKAISSSPCGHQGGEQNLMATKGSIDVGCGKYSYEIEAPLPPATCIDTNSLGWKGFVTPRASFLAAIGEFCKPDYQWAVGTDPSTATVNIFSINSKSINDATKLPNVCVAYDNKNKLRTWPNKCPKKGFNLDIDNTVTLSVVAGRDKACVPKQGKFLVKGDECKQMWMKAIDSCVPEGAGGMGGIYKEITADGCFEWWAAGNNPDDDKT